MGQYDALLKPFKIKGLTLKNRVMSTSHAPSYGEGGKPTERYQLYHEEKAKGGLALTMFGGSTSVALDSPASPWNQLSVADDGIIPYFQAFAQRVHRHGAALMCQITHMGRRTRWDTEHWLPTISASPRREPAHRSFPKEMEDWDLRRVIEAYGQGARRCREGGLDGCELICGSHLIDQFWSPRSNARSDGYGGSLENRMRFGFEVLGEMRRQASDDFVIGMRFSADELAEGGLTLEDCLTIARRHAEEGLVDFLNVNGGNVASHMELATALPNMAFPVAPFLYLASAVKAETGLPVFHACRITDIATAARAVDEGHLDMVAMTRAHMTDPHIVRKLIEDRVDDIRPCVGAAYCIDRIYVGGDALCLHNPATGREAELPHVIAKADRRRKVVVVGAGPAGLEAARVSAERGHEVVLFERADRTGGQVNIAAKAGWREALSGITRWLDGQVRRLGVELRLETEATRDAVLAEAPELVVIATGGRANKGWFEGSELAVSSWDILGGAVEPAENVLMFDDAADHQGLSCAEVMARRGSLVELVSPDRMVGEEIGSTNFSVHLRELYRHAVILTTDHRLTQVYREGNRFVAVLRNEYTYEEEERAVDQVVRCRAISVRWICRHWSTADRKTWSTTRTVGFACSASATRWPAATSTRRSTTRCGSARSSKSPL
jgi:2,4-dienoyl-CoA reductase-like NADH-dependent reductase (Old Yellow Enzyme family)